MHPDPSGKANLAIIAKTYAWRDMHRDVLCWAQQCQACSASKIAKHTNPPVLPIPIPPERFSHIHVDVVGPFAQPRLQVFAHDDRPNDALARSNTYRGHDGRHGLADVSWELGFLIRNPSHCDVGQGCAVHLAAVEHHPRAIRHQHFRHHLLPPAGQRTCRTVSPDTKKRPPLCRPLQPIVDTIAPVGAPRIVQCTQDRHGHFHLRSGLRSPTTYSWPLLSE